MNGNGGNVVISSGRGSGGVDGDITLSSGRGRVIINGQPVAPTPDLSEGDRLLVAFVVEEAKKKVAEYQRTLDMWLGANRERIERLGQIRQALEPHRETLNAAGIHPFVGDYIFGSGRQLALFGHPHCPETVGKTTFFREESGTKIIQSDSREFVVWRMCYPCSVTQCISYLEEWLTGIEDKLGKAIT